MKRFLCYVIIIFCFTFVGPINVKAATLSVNKDNIKLGDTFILYIKNTNKDSIYSLGYNSSLIEKRKYIGNYGNVSSVSGDGEITFYAKAAGTITFSFVDENELDSTQPIYVTIASNITTQSPQPQTSQTTQPQMTTQAKSNNNNIKSLSIIGDDGNDVVLSPEFKKDVYEYSATVASTVRMVDIIADLEDEKSNVVISNNANEELIAGENNKITITVTAEDGTKKSYVLNIKREAPDGNALLDTLTIKEYPDFKFKPEQFTYKIKIPANVKKLNIDYTVKGQKSTVQITDNSDLKDGSKVKILVEAEDGTKREYIIEIAKEKEEQKEEVEFSKERNPIIIMILSIIGFSLVGGIIYVIKKK